MDKSKEPWLKEVKSEPDKEIVEALEGLLKDAKAGELRLLYYGGVYQGGQYLYDTIGDEELWMLVIAIMSIQQTSLSFLQSGLLDDLDE